jgi:Ca2+:H+ antiporter
MYGEGKSNYFKGSILILAYFVVVIGFYLSVFVDPQMKGSYTVQVPVVSRIEQQSQSQGAA